MNELLKYMYNCDMIEMFGLCEELGIRLSFGFDKNTGEYAITVNWGNWYRTIYFDRDEPRNFMNRILKVVEELKQLDEDKEKKDD